MRCGLIIVTREHSVGRIPSAGDAKISTMPLTPSGQLPNFNYLFPIVLHSPNFTTCNPATIFFVTVITAAIKRNKFIFTQLRSIYTRYICDPCRLSF